ncbi:hypothetical protein AHiyo6_13960 [Arthrobacter sp. Hiyo6]|jgi:hypothetical protein|nr:hypothetical protein AHiyo6_13960 [Arthrobacter sp. Hiyo6]
MARVFEWMRAISAARLDWIGQRSGTAYYFANEHNAASIELHIGSYRPRSFSAVTQSCAIAFCAADSVTL